MAILLNLVRLETFIHGLSMSCPSFVHRLYPPTKGYVTLLPAKRLQVNFGNKTNLVFCFGAIGMQHGRVILLYYCFGQRTFSTLCFGGVWIWDSVMVLGSVYHYIFLNPSPILTVNLSQP